MNCEVNPFLFLFKTIMKRNLLITDRQISSVFSEGNFGGFVFVIFWPSPFIIFKIVHLILKPKMFVFM